MSAEEHNPEAAGPDDRSGVEDQPKRPEAGEKEATTEDLAGQEEFDDDFPFPDIPRMARERRYLIYAPNGNINTASVHGDQRVENTGATAGTGGRRVEAHEGPISALEILDAQAGYAEPDWFPTALRELDTGLLFLVGESGTGRRSAALNLLSRHAGSMGLRALDSDVDLTSWQPTHTGTRGYLVYGLLPQRPLGPGVIANLRSLLSEADARMVIVLPDDPEVVRDLSRDLPVSPVRCDPPPPRAVFDAQLEHAAPDPAERVRLRARLEPGLLEELLTPELVPAQVAELVTAVSRTDGDELGLTDLRDRLSFLAEKEAPDLIKKLRDDPDGLAFLLATCVFEGLDQRVIREEAERLLVLADGRLDAVLPQRDEDGQESSRYQNRLVANPQFVFRRSLDDLLGAVRAECAPKEIRSTASYTYAVEPVRFKRHRQGETVLRHVWRQYGQLSGLLTDWMDNVPGNEHELAEPVGRVMGLAVGWGGGRRALRHIRRLADSEHRTSRTVAAYALGMAAEDPVLASEVKYRLGSWSSRTSWRLRSTVAYACGTDFGASRPDMAVRLLRQAYRGRDGDEHTVGLAVRRALHQLFAAGRQQTVFRHLAEWAAREGAEADLSLWTFQSLLWERSWFQEQLLVEDELAERIVGLVHQSLNDDKLFDGTCSSLIDWCRAGVWDQQQNLAVETLLTALTHEMRHGALRLFVAMDRDNTTELAGLHIARHALTVWRNGESPRDHPTYSHGAHDEH